MQFRRAHLVRAEANGTLLPGQAEKLWQDLSLQKAEEPTFKAQHVLYYLGGMFVGVAVLLLGSVLEFQIGPAAAATFAALVMLALLFFAERMHKKGRRVATGVLATVGALLAPVVVLFGCTALGTPLSGVFSDRVLSALAVSSTLALALTAYLRFRVSFLMLPVTASGAVLIDALFTRGLEYGHGRLNTLCHLEVAYGLVLLAIAALVDYQARHTLRDHSFWLWLCGAALVWGCALDNVPGHLGLLGWSVFNLVLIGVATLVSRRSLAVFGAIGLAGASVWLSGSFKHSGLTAVAVLVSGLLLIYGGLRWPTIEVSVRRMVRLRSAAGSRENSVG